MKKLLLLFITSFIYSATIHVPGDYTSIQTAVVSSQDGDSILVSSGTYNESVWITSKAIYVIGEDMENTIIDANLINGPAVHIDAQVDDNEVTFENFTILNGGCGDCGSSQNAAFVVKYSSPNLNNLHITQSKSRGMWFEVSQARINGLEIDNNTYNPNHWFSGGAIYANFSSIHLENIDLHDNWGGEGGAIRTMFYTWPHQNETIIIKNGRIVNNTAYYGGGAMMLSDTNIKLEGLLIADNYTNNYGGGIRVDNAAHLEIVNSTIVNNVDNIEYNGNSASNLWLLAPEVWNTNCECSNLKISNSIIWQEVESELDSGAGVYLGNGYPLYDYIDYSYILYVTGVNTPEFTDSENGDYTIQYGSPCIDVGNPDLDGDGITWEYDIDDQDPDGTRKDIGTYYFDQSMYDCTDPEACNYDPEALYDDGSCVYGDNCYGCTNPDAMNYEEDAVFDDGSCVVPDIIVPDDYGTIQGALDAACANCTIFVRSGTYYENLEMNFHWDVPFYGGVNLIGEDKETTIIDGSNDNCPVFTMKDTSPNYDSKSQLNMRNFTIQNGQGDCNTPNLGLNGNRGGGIASEDVVLQLENMIFQNNWTSNNGGGLYVEFGDTSWEDDYLILDGVDFYNNQANGNGGAVNIKSVANGNGSNEGIDYININNCNISNNSSINGSAILLNGRHSFIDINNSTITNNTSSESGPAGIFFNDMQNSQGNYSVIRNSIISNNHGLYQPFNVSQSGGSYLYAINTIITNDMDGIHVSGLSAYSCIISGLSFQNISHYNSLDIDPGFIDAENGNYELVDGSPCVDSGIDYLSAAGNILINLSPDEYEGFAPDIGPWETSQMFVPDPIITNIQDIDNDQGGRAYLDFQRSFHDKDGFANRVEVYTVERFDDEWVSIETLSAYNDSTYRVEVTTLIDSSSTSDGLTDFRVIANMEEGNFLSETSAGYSVDNIHPSVPDELFASSSEQDVNLSWSYSEDIDFAHHMVSDIDNNPAYTIDNDIFIPLATDYNEYHVNSMDINGNMSDNSEYASAYDLSQGANLISFSILPEDNGIENVILSEDVSSVIGEGIAAMQISNGQWVGSLVSIYPDQGYWVKSSNGEILNTVGLRNEITDFNLNAGANLISYTCDQSAPVEDIIQDMEITSVIGEGLATTYNPVLGWVGSLSSLEPGSGYWFKADSDVDFSFDCPESETFSREYVEAPIKDYIQSTEQAFYFFGNIPEAEEGDVIRAYNGDILVGSRVWNGSYTDVPAMGKDFQSETQGFLSDSDVPTFKLIKKSGEELALEADIPGWSSNGIFIIENASSSQIIPDNFGLASAYPNPFNPTTTIGFQVPYSSNVILEIYDITGRKIRQLANNYYTPGYHSVVWDASDVSSGVYFVKMNADGFNASQKLMLIK